MIRPAIFSSLISLCACATGASAAHHAAPVGKRAVVSNANIPATPLHLKRRPLRPSASALVRVDAANRAAKQEPSRDSYIGAVQVYAWTEGGLYRLYTAPEQISDIALESGENLVSVAAGDTARWVIGDTTSGTGAQRRTHILLKPSAAGLSTNLVIATDRRVYHLELSSSPKSAMASVSWIYPEDPLLALRGAITSDASVTPDVAVEALNFDYRIEGDRPAWRPVRAFDDGHQVFIEFPPGLSEGEAPPLFVTGERGRVELVNYRLRGRYYVVDGLFSSAELRLGERRQQVVRIVRDNPVPVRSRKSS